MDPQVITVHGAAEDVQVIEKPKDLKGMNITASERKLFGGPSQPSSKPAPKPNTTTDQEEVIK
jgi:hypothetical protein